MMQRWAIGTLLASFALLPIGRMAELPMALASLGGLALLLRQGMNFQRWDVRAATLAFLAYWLPELGSAFDSVAPGKSWREVAVDLRYLPMLLFWVAGLREPAARRVVSSGIGILVGLWILDGLVQAATGWSLGGAFSADRLSGIFGADDLKLGPMLAVLCPFLLALLHTSRWPLRLTGIIALLVVVLLAGTRSAWLMLLVGIAVMYLPLMGTRRALAMLGAIALGMSLLGALAYQYSAPFEARIERSLQAWRGDSEGLDHALAGRLPIWSTASSMITAHPVNGVGVRAFRHAYAEHAQPDDPWLDFQAEGGAAHAHQIVLEVLSETGVLGLLLWLSAVIGLLRCSVRNAEDNPAAHAALAAMLFPLNTHYAIYSSAWGGLLMCLIALWISQRRARNPLPC